MSTNIFLPNPDCVYYMFNKPAGFITAKSDLRHPTVMEFFKEINNADFHPMGRLDKDTEGLLLFTDDGQFTNYLMSPQNHIPKTYEFGALGDLTPEYIEELENGIYFKGSDKITSPCKIHITTKSSLKEVFPLVSNTKQRSLYKNHPEHPFTFGTITITEGRKHHIKRLMKYAHCCIITLKRVSIGNLQLDPSLLPGEYRTLTYEELQYLCTQKIFQ